MTSSYFYTKLHDILVASVCLSVYMYVCNTITFESLDLRKFIFGLQGQLHLIRVKFLYESHRIRVKVTGAKNHEISIVAM